MNKRQYKRKRNNYIKNGTAKSRRRNKELCRRYPFLVPRQVWSGKVIWDIYHYIKRWSYTELDAIPAGWRKAFGIMLCDELKADLESNGCLHSFRTDQIKEKFGQLRWYFHGTKSGSNAYDIIDKYSKLSENICIRCGKPDTWVIYDGWVSPYCFDCYRKIWRDREKFLKKYHEDFVPATEEEIQEAYEKSKCGDSPLMADKRVYTTYKDCVNQKVEVDISETANKIRENWGKNK